MTTRHEAINGGTRLDSIYLDRPVGRFKDKVEAEAWRSLTLQGDRVRIVELYSDVGRITTLIPVSNIIGMAITCAPPNDSAWGIDGSRPSKAPRAAEAAKAAKAAKEAMEARIARNAALVAKVKP